MKMFALCLLIMVLLGLPVYGWGQEEGQPEGSPEAVEAAQAQEEPAAADEAQATEEATGTEEAWEEIAELPPMHYVLEPEFYTWLGGRYADVNGSNRAMEYGWPHSSVAGGFKIHYSPLPHRLDTELDWLNVNDYQAEFGYAYKDIIKVNYVGWALWHNLDHFVPQPNVPVSPTVERDPGTEYSVEARDNRLNLRFKWPDRAYHLFAEFRQFEKEGTIQQRFYARPAGANVKVSQSRDIDWITRHYKAGVNGHFGPVEVEYYHKVKTFDPHREVRLFDTYIFGTGQQHNAVPELETDTDTVRVHTDLTGRVVASATLINGEKENDASRSSVDFRRAYGDITLIPFERMTIALRYKYRELETVSPAVVDIRNNSGPSVLTTDPMDSRVNSAEVTVRYSPINELGMKAEYRFEKTERQNFLGWTDRDIIPFQDMPADQNRHAVKLGFNARPLGGVDLKGSIDYTYVQDPAYPAKPKNSFKGRFDAGFIPHYSVNAEVYYRFAREENNTANMDLERDNVGALVSWAPAERLSFYANYDYSRLKNERDLKFNSSTAGLTFPLDRVPYRDRSHLYAVGAGYGFAFPLSVNAEFYQSFSRGMFRTDVSNTIVTTAAVGGLTDMRIRETGGSVMARYDFPRGWGASVSYRVNDFEDLEDRPQDGDQDGTAQTALVMVSKKW